MGPEFCTPSKKRHHQIHIRTPQHCKWSLFPHCIYFLEILVILPLLLLVSAGLRSVRSIFHDCSCWSSACAELCSVIYSLFIFVAIVAWTNYFLSLRCGGVAFGECLFYRRRFLKEEPKLGHGVLCSAPFKRHREDLPGGEKVGE